MKIKKTIVAVFNFALAAVFSLAGCDFGGEPGKDSSDVTDSVESDIGIENPDSSDEEKAPENVVENGGSYMMPKAMSFTSASLAAASDAGITVELTAVVTPEDAPDKSVDWTAAWAPGAALSGEPVEDYLTLQPDSDGSQTVQVTCKKAFVDNVIIITVTTRDGGFQDFCDVTFVGIPTYMMLDTEAWTVESDEYFISSYYVFGVGRTYEADIVLSNVLDSVSSSYYADENFEIELTAKGSIVVQDYYLGSTSGNEGVWTGEEKTVLLSSVADKFFDVEISDGTLRITPKMLIENYYGDYEYSSGNRTYVGKFKNFGSGWSADTCKFGLKITEKTTGLVTEIGLADYDTSILIKSLVTGVSVDSTLEF